MKKVEISNVDSHTSSGAVFRPLSAALGTTDLAINYYELAPGDNFGHYYHCLDTGTRNDARPPSDPPPSPTRATQRLVRLP